MKNLFKFLGIFCALAIPVSAQEGDGYGFLNIANLIPGDVPCEIQIGGKDLVPDGLKAGTYTGWFMAKTGSKSMTVSMGELASASGNIQLVEGQGNLVGIFLEPDTRRNSEGRLYPPKIRIKSFPTYETKGYGLKFVSLCPGENRFQLGSLKLDPKTFTPVEIPKWNGGGFEIFRNGDSIGKVSGSTESGAFYLLVGAGVEGEFASVIVSANKQEVPEYLKPEKTKREPAATTSEKPDPNP